MDKIGKIGKKLFSYSPTEFLFMSDGQFISKNVTSWKYNRPPDNLKISEIVKVIEENNRYTIEGIVYVAFIDNKFVCYDGNHRLEALKLLKTKKLVLVNCMIAKDDDQIKKRFIELNKSNPVPELYKLEPSTDTDKLKTVLEAVVDNLCKTYSKFRSASAHPHKPNFNKDVLLSALFTRFKCENIAKLSSSQIYADILSLNKDYSKEKHIRHSKFSNGIINKCKKYGCYLFLKDFSEDL